MVDYKKLAEIAACPIEKGGDTDIKTWFLVDVLLKKLDIPIDTLLVCYAYDFIRIKQRKLRYENIYIDILTSYDLPQRFIDYRKTRKEIKKAMC